MATLAKEDLISALTRLGALAITTCGNVELVLVGGGLMVLAFGTRNATRDVDVVIISPDSASVRSISETVALERGWPADWLNDAAKGFMIGVSNGPVVFSAPGIIVRRPSFEQLLAMKLCAWRDDVDIADARRLLQELQGSYNEVWQRLTGFLQPGRELKARYAFDDLWDETHDKH